MYLLYCLIYLARDISEVIHYETFTLTSNGLDHNNRRPVAFNETDFYTTQPKNKLI